MRCPRSLLQEKVHNDVLKPFLIVWTCGAVITVYDDDDGQEGERRCLPVRRAGVRQSHCISTRPAATLRCSVAIRSSCRRCPSDRRTPTSPPGPSLSTQQQQQEPQSASASPHEERSTPVACRSGIRRRRPAACSAAARRRPRRAARVHAARAQIKLIDLG